MRRFFGVEESLLDGYRQMAGHLEDEGYKYLFDKVPAISRRRTKKICAQADKVIFTVRDVRTWLAKEPVRRHYQCEENAVPAAVDYVLHFIDSFRYVGDHFLHVDFSDFISPSPAVPHEVAHFLEIEDQQSSLTRWWEKEVSNAEEEPFEGIHSWHQRWSSMSEPQSDTTVQLSDARFWDERLPIFDRYKENLNEPVGKRRIEKDKHTLNKLRRREIFLSDLYQQLETERIGQTSKNDLNLLGKILFAAGNRSVQLAQKFRKS